MSQTDKVLARKQGGVGILTFNNPDRHTNFGAVVGYVAGIFAALSTCGTESYCGEDNPAPLLGAIVGAFVGHFITDDWVSVTH